MGLGVFCMFLTEKYHVNLTQCTERNVIFPELMRDAEVAGQFSIWYNKSKSVNEIRIIKE